MAAWTAATAAVFCALAAMHARVAAGAQPLAVAAATVAAATVGAAPSVAAIIEGTAHQALFAVAFEGEKGTAVGAAGQILLTEDGGKNWHASKQSGATALSLLGVDVGAGEQIAVGQSGLVLVTAGGDTWRQVEAASHERLFAVSMNRHGKAAAVGAFGTIVSSSDHGSSWVSVAPPDLAKYSDQGADPHLYAVVLDDQDVVTVAGEFGLILRSADQGKHWTMLHKGDASLFGLQLRDDGIGFAVGQSGTILRSIDKGATWTQIPSGSTANLLAVGSDPSGHVLITAMNSVLASSDAGISWATLHWGDFGSSWYGGVHFVESQPTTAILVGHAGRILRMNP